MIATNNGGFPWRGTALEGELNEALARRDRLALGELRALQDRATRQAIEAQVRSGLDLVTDGMVRREDPVSHPAARLQGFVPGEGRRSFPGSGVPSPVLVAASEISWKEPILVEDFLFAREGTAATVKVVLTGPYTLAHLAEDRAYDDPMALAMAIATALNQELRALQAVGASFLQVDEPALLSRPEDFPTFTRIWEVLGRGVTATLCLHLEGGPIEGLYPGLVRLKRLGCLSLDCVRGRAGLDALRTEPLPAGVRLGLGIVDARLATVESAVDLAALVRSLPGLPPPDRLLLGTVSDLGGLGAETAAAKLKSLAQAARILHNG